MNLKIKEKINTYEVKDICNYSIEKLKWDIYRKMSKVLSWIYWKPKGLFKRMVRKRLNSKILEINNESVWIINYSKYIEYDGIWWLKLLDKGFIHVSSKFIFKWYEWNWYGYLLEHILFEEVKNKKIDGLRFSITPGKSWNALWFVMKFGAKKIYEQYDNRRNLFEYYMVYDFYNKMRTYEHKLQANEDILKKKVLLWSVDDFKDIKIEDTLIINGKKKVRVKNIRFFPNKVKHPDFAIWHILKVYETLSENDIENLSLRYEKIKRWIIVIEFE